MLFAVGHRTINPSNRSDGFHGCFITMKSHARKKKPSIEACIFLFIWRWLRRKIRIGDIEASTISGFFLQALVPASIEEIHLRVPFWGVQRTYILYHCTHHYVFGCVAQLCTELVLESVVFCHLIAWIVVKVWAVQRLLWVHRIMSLCVQLLPAYWPF